MSLVLTGQYTNEEYDSLLTFWKGQFGVDGVFHWTNHEEKWDEFDGLLIRGDKNPNSNGLKKALEKHGIVAQKDFSKLKDKDLVVVAGPENQWVYDDIKEKAQIFAQNKKVVWLSACILPQTDDVHGDFQFVPMKTFIEKSGTFTNYDGKEQSFVAIEIFVPQALSLTEMAQILTGEIKSWTLPEQVERVNNEFAHERRTTWVL